MDTKSIGTDENSCDSHSKRSYRRYMIEMGVALAAYAVTMVLRAWLFFGPLGLAQKPWLSIAVALLPAIPIGFMVFAIRRVIRSMDELMRRIQIESLAIAGIVTALLAVIYGFLENPPWFPYLSAWWTYGVFGITWFGASLLLKRQYAE